MRTKRETPTQKKKRRIGDVKRAYSRFAKAYIHEPHVVRLMDIAGARAVFRRNRRAQRKKNKFDKLKQNRHLIDIFWIIIVDFDRIFENFENCSTA